MDLLWQDLQHSVRTLRRQPGPAAVIVLTLALGLGLNAAVFTQVRSTLLRPLQYLEPDRLVMIWTTIPAQGVKQTTSAFANVEDWRSRTRTFDDVASYDHTTLTLTGGEWAERTAAVRASSNLFGVLGVAPALGRSFTPEEEQDRAAVVVVSHEFWQTHLGGSARGSIEISGNRFEVVGVMPEGFGFPETGTQLWLPQTLFTDWEAQRAQRGTGAWRVIARLRPGASLEDARAEMSSAAAHLEQQHPGMNAGLGASVVPLHEHVAGGTVRTTLWMLFGAAAFVLLLACANAAHIILARNLDRQREFAIRQALGATARRLIRQSVTENVVLGVISGIGALLLAQAGTRLLVALSPPGTPRIDEVAIDGAVLAYVAIVALGASLLIGTLPAARSARADRYASLRDAGAAVGGVRGQRMRSMLIAFQFALAVVLVFGANLLGRSLMEARSVEAGFAADVLLANLSVEAQERRIPFYEQVIDEVSAIPGVTGAGLIEDLFISGAPGRAVTVEGQEAGGPAFEEIRSDAIAGALFSTIGVPLLEGRDFSDADHDGAPPVAIINETMARRFWPGTSALGRRFRFGGAQAAAPWIEVVGVVRDMRRQGPEKEPIAQVFRPFVQEPSRNMNLVVRSSDPAEPLMTTIRTRLADVDRSVPLYHITTTERALNRYLVQRRYQAFLMAVFSTVALVLAAVGVHGLMQYSVSRRAHELAVRVALGASPGGLMAMVMRHAALLALPGIAAGTLGAVWIAGSISALLFGVAAADPVGILAPAFVLLVAALAATWVPARRAARTDPISALRSR